MIGATLSAFMLRRRASWFTVSAYEKLTLQTRWTDYGSADTQIAILNNNTGNGQVNFISAAIVDALIKR